MTQRERNTGHLTRDILSHLADGQASEGDPLAKLSQLTNDFQDVRLRRGRHRNQ